jgi:tetratricopeptide (TPR) repeat protein
MGVERGTVHPILISATLIGFFVVYFRFVFGFFMRNFERQADLHVYRFSTDPSPLISTFYKIASFSRQSMDKPNWHHFSIGQRIRFLEVCREDTALIEAHHSRVKKMMVVYFLVVTLVVGMGYFINYGRAGEAFNNFIAGKILFRQMEVAPENSDLYVLVGDYYYSKEKYQEAIDSYENVLRVDPENVHALNNLSWLFATCPDPVFRNRKKALATALKALEQKREAFVLDTYAEALFVNNETGAAVRAAREALEISTDKRDYYESQLVRFKKGLTP